MYGFMKLSNATRKIIEKAKLGDAVYTILEVDGSICDSCSQIKKNLAIKKVYVGRVEEALDGGRRLTLYRETPTTLKNSRNGISEFHQVAIAYYGTGNYLSLKKDDLLPQLEYNLKSNKKLDEYRVERESES